MFIYRLYCEVCNWTRITDGTDDNNLIKLKSSSIQETIPTLENKAGKFKESKPKYRCPQCGRVVSPKKIEDPQFKIIQKIEQENREAILRKEKDEHLELMNQRAEEIIQEQKRREREIKLRRKLEAEENLNEFEK